MKQANIFLAIVGVFAIIACNKEAEHKSLSSDSNKVRAVIQADFSEATKTSYANEITFSWTQGDKIGVWTTNGTSFEKVIFEAQASGPSVSFEGDLSAGFYLVPDGKAFYPDGDAEENNNLVSTFDGTDYTVTLGATIDVNLDNPMSVIPLIGNNDGTGKYSFTTATGIVKVSYEALKSTVAYLYLDYNNIQDVALSGTFSLDNDEIKLVNASAFDDVKALKVSGLIEGISGVFYFPIPTGTLPTGLYFSTVNSTMGFLTYEQATKTIPVVRNKITNISTAINGGSSSSWELLGKGFFKDDYSFALVGKAGYMVPVDILKSKTDSKLFAVVDPYGTAWQLFGETYDSASSTNLMHLAVKKSGDTIATTSYSTDVSVDNLVFFYGNNTSGNDLVNEPILTGMSGSGKPYRVYHPRWLKSATQDQMLNSKVVSFQADGTTPAVITLAPALQKAAYNGDVYWLNDAKDAIYIIFPGCNPAAAVAGTYNIYENTTAKQIAFSESDNLSKGNVMISGYPTWSLTGKLYGVYDCENGSVTIEKNQTFDVYNTNQYYYPFMGTDHANNVDIVFDFDTSFLSDTPGDSKKLLVGRILKTRNDGFGIAYHKDSPTGTRYTTSHQWIDGGQVCLYKVR